MSLKETRSVGRVTEITSIVPFKQGVPEGLHGIRYADRCRIVLEAFADLEREGFASPVRRFSGIHFARWTLIDADTRLLFTTNFDGSWEDYIGDFVRKIPWSLGLIWCNCVGYPEDRGVQPGAADYELFSRYVRHTQVPAGLFYAHYSHLTVRDIRYLQIFHDEVTRTLKDGDSGSGQNGGPAPTLAEIERRAMARQRQVEAAYDMLPIRPFPDEKCLVAMGDPQKEIFQKRIGEPIRELYLRAYDDEQAQKILDKVFEEFQLVTGK